MERLIVNFLYAGSSAWLLSLIKIYPECWYLSLIALCPFLWRLTRVDFRDSMLLGAILPAAYFFATSGQIILPDFSEAILKLVALLTVFIGFAVIVNLVSRKIGFYVVLIALMWLPLEHFLTQDSLFGGILTLPELNSAVLMRFGSLFGLLMISFLIVLINSLLLCIVDFAIKTLQKAKGKIVRDETTFLQDYGHHTIIRIKFYLPVLRAPPPIQCEILLILGGFGY